MQIGVRQFKAQCLRLIVRYSRVARKLIKLKDPADRMIAATARSLGGVLVTGDRQLLDYGAQGFVATLSA